MKDLFYIVNVFNNLKFGRELLVERGMEGGMAK